MWVENLCNGAEAPAPRSHTSVSSAQRETQNLPPNPILPMLGPSQTIAIVGRHFLG